VRMLAQQHAAGMLRSAALARQAQTGRCGRKRRRPTCSPSAGAPHARSRRVSAGGLAPFSGRDLDDFDEFATPDLDFFAAMNAIVGGRRGSVMDLAARRLYSD
jgi:hypothetical protein